MPSYVGGPVFANDRASDDDTRQRDWKAAIEHRLTRRTFLGRTMGLAISLPLVTLLAACGGDDDDDATAPPASTENDGTTSTAAASTGESAAESTALMATEPATAESSPAQASAFPVTVEHKFGSTEISAAPTRVVSLGYNDHDTLLAFGVTPVAARYWYGDENNVVPPWSQDAVEGSVPEVLNMPELDVELVASYDPDLIVAVYSGITEDEYATLSQIAPTVAQLGDYIDYGMPWEDTTRLIGAALGQPERAEELIADVEAEFAAARSANPTFADATVIVAAMGSDGSIGLFAEQDGRTRILTGLGLTVAAEILPLFDADLFYTDLSGEQTNILDSADVIIWTQVVFAGGRATIEENPLYQQLTVSQEGRHVFVEGSIDDAMAFNSALSLPYALESLVPHLIAALDGDPATNEPPMT